MSDEKIKTEELKDEEMNKATGGSFVFVDPTKKPKKCANPACNAYLPYNYPNKFCSKCMKDKSDTDVPTGRPRPLDLT